MAAADESQAPTVLVVEDDRAVRDLLETLLTGEGLRVTAARDGLEGLLKMRMHTPAVVILDIMMPDVGGLRVLDELAEEHARTPVIVVTGKPEAAEEARARLGVRNVFDKPFDVDDLVVRVKELIAGEVG